MNKAESLTVVIAEDNPGSRQNLISCLEKAGEKAGGIEVIGAADNGCDAVDLINRKKPDLVFLDVDMPGKNGFEVLQAIDHNPGVIFVTAHEQFAVKAFDVNGIDYIVKPVALQRLEQALEKVKAAMDTDKEKLTAFLDRMMNQKTYKKRFAVKVKDQVLIIPKVEVFEFKAEDKYVFLVTDNQSYFYNATLKKLMEDLDPNKFIRVNKSHIVSIEKIIKLKRNYKLETCLVLGDQKKTTIKISKTHLKALKKRLEE